MTPAQVGAETPRNSRPGQHGHLLGAGQAGATPAGARAAPRAFPAVPPPPGQGWAAGACWQQGKSLSAASRPGRRPRLEELCGHTWPQPLPAASACSAASSAWVTAGTSHPSSPGPAATASSCVPAQALCAFARVCGVMLGAAELGPCAVSSPVAAGAGNGYWFSGLQPFPFTC